MGKTFAFQLWKQGTDLTYIMRMLNHSSARKTLVNITVEQTRRNLCKPKSLNLGGFYMKEIVDETVITCSVCGLNFDEANVNIIDYDLDLCGICVDMKLNCLRLLMLQNLQILPQLSGQRARINSYLEFYQRARRV